MCPGRNATSAAGTPNARAARATFRPFPPGVTTTFAWLLRRGGGVERHDHGVVAREPLRELGNVLVARAGRGERAIGADRVLRDAQPARRAVLFLEPDRIRLLALVGLDVLGGQREAHRVVVGLEQAHQADRLRARRASQHDVAGLRLRRAGGLRGGGGRAGAGRIVVVAAAGEDEYEHRRDDHDGGADQDRAAEAG
jgi:hypothetical protein